ncbi:FAD-binding oxidoreductase [Glutamicibacter endophyticus]
MLSTQSRPLIEATLPLIGERIGRITPVFYRRLFAAHPELLDGTFSRSNQRNGRQQQALAGSIATFASYLLANPQALPETLLSRIAHKHASLGVREEQYPVVYEHLFAAIAEDLGDTLAPEIAAAWTEVYWLMAHALIKLERELYAAQPNSVDYSAWRLVQRQTESTNCVSFSFEPLDETPVAAARPGQFVSLRLPVADGTRQVRQYTLSQQPEATSRRHITVKLDVDGEVSTTLHSLQPGAVVELSNPYGDLVIDAEGTPLVIATAGIGCTPAAAALSSLAAAGSVRRLSILHAEASVEAWALQHQMLDSLRQLPQATLSTWFEHGPLPEAYESRQGLMDLTGHVDEHSELYLCGPLPFMHALRSQALSLGVPAQKIHYEVFGPDVWLAA